MSLFRVWDNQKQRYTKPEDGLFCMTAGGELNVTNFSLIPKELRELSYDYNENRYEVEFSSQKYDANKNELFENDLIQLYDSIYKVHYNPADGSWGTIFVKRLKEWKVGEVPGYVYTKPEVWSRSAVLVGNVRTSHIEG